MEALTLVTDKRIKQLILSGKVAIKCAAGDAGCLAYCEDGHAMHPRPKDYILCGGEYCGDRGFGTAASSAAARRMGGRRRCCGSLTRLTSDCRRLRRLPCGLGFGSLFRNRCFHRILLPCARSATSPAEILQHFTVHVQQPTARDWFVIANIFSIRVQFNVILGYGAANPES